MLSLVSFNTDVGLALTITSATAGETTLILQIRHPYHLNIQNSKVDGDRVDRYVTWIVEKSRRETQEP